MPFSTQPELNSLSAFAIKCGKLLNSFKSVFLQIQPSLLHFAAYYNLTIWIKRLIKSNYDVNRVDGGCTALDIALINKNELIIKDLINAGAIGTSYFKLIGHSLGLDNTFNFHSRTGTYIVPYEGLIPCITIPAITKHLIKFNENFQNNAENNLDEKQAVNIATESFKTMLEDESNSSKINQFNRYNAKNPIVTPLNSQNHCISTVLYKDLFGIIDKSTSRIEFAKIETSPLKKLDTFNNVLNFMSQFDRTTESALHALANYLNPKHLLNYVTKHQSVGNCSYKNIKGGFQGILVALQLDAQMLENKQVNGELLSDDEKKLLIFKNLDHKKISNQFSYSDVIQSIDEHCDSFKNNSMPNRWHPFQQYFSNKYNPNKPRHVGIMDHINSKFGSNSFKSNFPKFKA